MYEQDYFDGCYEDYEPNEWDRFDKELALLKDKMLETLEGDVKSELTYLRKRDIEFSNLQEEMRKEINEYQNLQRELEHQKERLEWQVKEDFYKETLSDSLEKLMEDAVVWTKDRTPVEREKCRKCNEERKIIAKFPDGTIAKKDCECADLDYIYRPSACNLKTINIIKKHKDRKFFLKEEYIPSEKNSWYQDIYYKSEFQLKIILEKFNEAKIKEIEEELGIYEEIGFSTEEECQKYCDYLNGKEHS